MGSAAACSWPAPRLWGEHAPLQITLFGGNVISWKTAAGKEGEPGVVLGPHAAPQLCRCSTACSAASELQCAFACHSTPRVQVCLRTCCRKRVRGSPSAAACSRADRPVTCCPCRPLQFCTSVPTPFLTAPSPSPAASPTASPSSARVRSPAGGPRTCCPPAIHRHVCTPAYSPPAAPFHPSTHTPVHPLLALFSRRHPAARLCAQRGLVAGRRLGGGRQPGGHTGAHRQRLHSRHVAPRLQGRPGEGVLRVGCGRAVVRLSPGGLATPWAQSRGCHAALAQRGEPRRLCRRLAPGPPACALLCNKPLPV